MVARPAGLAGNACAVARRRAPFGAPLVALLALTAMAFTAERFVPATATTLCRHGGGLDRLGAHNALPAATAGLGATVALVLVVVGHDPTSTIGQALSVFVVITVSWAIGIGWYRRTRHAAALEQRALRAEREREAGARIAVAEERARIARELHDVVAHSVTVMVSTPAPCAPRDPHLDEEHERDGLLTIESTGREALAEMRRLLGAMKSRQRGVLELGPQPGARPARSARRPHTCVRPGRPGPRRGRPVPWRRASTCPPIESSRKGSRTRSSTPARRGPRSSYRYGSRDVEVEVVDDGHAAREADSAGHGLVGMRERVKLYGGDFEAGPRAGGGFAVRARLPLSPGLA